MKKIEYCLTFILITILFTSCFEDKDNWYSSTKEYDGRYSVAITCEEYSAHDQTIRDGHELKIYNTAVNKENQIFIDSYVAIDSDAGSSYHVKGRFDVEGDISGFKATTPSDNSARSEELNTSEYALLDANGEPTVSISRLPAPTKAGEEYDGFQFYSRLSIVQGKITPKGATTIGGNTSDAVSLSIITYCDYLTIESYLLDEADWSVIGVPEYDWRVKDGSRVIAGADYEEHWNFEGYRYTGFPEDNPSTQPPITEK